MLELGFACSWWWPRESTWSYTPSRLLHALGQQEGVRLTSIEAQRPLLGRAALKLAHGALSPNGWEDGWANRALTAHKVARAVERVPVDAVLAVGEVEPVLPVPTFFYQDMSFGVGLAHFDRLGARAPNMPRMTRRRLSRLASAQRDRYQSCAGVLTMSRWFADWLMKEEGLSPGMVHAVGGGLSPVPVRPRAASGGEKRERLLFVGRDFFRKGGDLVVEAVAQLRASGDGPYRLTVVGPSVWPLKGDPPPWVDFRGCLAPGEVAGLWPDHDVFVLPSWFEAYGLVFLEARAAGLPCVARRAFSMPELVPEGRAGSLVAERGGVHEVAEAIRAVSTDDALFEQVRYEAESVARENSWNSVAVRALAAIRRS